jgi:hypothetical protein
MKARNNIEAQESALKTCSSSDEHSTKYALKRNEKMWLGLKEISGYPTSTMLSSKFHGGG